MPYCQLFYHLVWATKGRGPFLDDTNETVIYELLRGKAIGLGATVYALNGTTDHVHLLVALPPRLAVAAFIGQVKGAAAATYNKMRPASAQLHWQDGYGAFSCEGHRLAHFIGYVQRQKTHHQQQTTIAVLERTDEPSANLCKEPDAVYLLEDASWRTSLERLE